MNGHHRSHIWLHFGLAAAILAVIELNAIGIAVPSAFTYLIVLACPLMMVVMMMTMMKTDDGHEAGEDSKAVPDHT